MRVSGIDNCEGYSTRTILFVTKYGIHVMLNSRDIDTS